jgi:hypothetical protein
MMPHHQFLQNSTWYNDERLSIGESGKWPSRGHCLFLRALMLFCEASSLICNLFEGATVQ